MLYRLLHEQGLGDAVMLSAVIAHIRHYRPEARIELIVQPGRERLYEVRSQASGVRRQHAQAYDASVDEVTCERDLRRPPTHRVDWPMPNASRRGVPCTWVERYLKETLRLMPIETLCRSRVPVSAEDVAHARQWLEQSGIRQASAQIALLHAAGVSFADKKNPDDFQAAGICAALHNAGYRVLLLDEAGTSPLAKEGLALRVAPSLLRRAAGSALDAGCLAGLIGACDLFVGVDSGPLHVAGAIGAPAIGLWPRQAPLHCIHPDDTTTHLVLKNGRRQPERFLIHPPVDDGLPYLLDHYRVAWCDDFGHAIAEQLDALQLTTGH